MLKLLIQCTLISQLMAKVLDGSKWACTGRPYRRLLKISNNYVWMKRLVRGINHQRSIGSSRVRFLGKSFSFGFGFFLLLLSSMKTAIPRDVFCTGKEEWILCAYRRTSISDRRTGDCTDPNSCVYLLYVGLLIMVLVHPIFCFLVHSLSQKSICLPLIVCLGFMCQGGGKSTVHDCVILHNIPYTWYRQDDEGKTNQTRLSFVIVHWRILFSLYWQTLLLETEQVGRAFMDVPLKMKTLILLMADRAHWGELEERELLMHHDWCLTSSCVCPVHNSFPRLTKSWMLCI